MLKRLRKSREEDEGGFTLIELLVVIIIIGILAAIAIPTFLNQRKKGWDSAAKSALKNAATAQESYFSDHDEYADTLDELRAEGYNEVSTGNNAVDLVITLTGTPPNAYKMTAKHARADNTWCLNSGAGGKIVKGTTC